MKSSPNEGLSGGMAVGLHMQNIEVCSYLVIFFLLFLLFLYIIFFILF